jgi:hypothetical protein
MAVHPSPREVGQLLKALRARHSAGDSNRKSHGELTLDYVLHILCTCDENSDDLKSKLKQYLISLTDEKQVDELMDLSRACYRSTWSDIGEILLDFLTSILLHGNMLGGLSSGRRLALCDLFLEWMGQVVKNDLLDDLLDENLSVMWGIK